MIIIGISGAPGSGKTTIAHRLKEHYGDARCMVFSPKTIQSREKLEILDVSLHSTLQSLKEGEDRSQIIIVEGSSLYNSTLLPLLDIKLFIQTDLDLCLIRLLKRNPEQTHEILMNYEMSLRTLQIQAMTTGKAAADVVIRNEKEVFDLDLIPALDYIAERLHLPLTHRDSPCWISPSFDATSVKRETPGTLFVISGPSGVGKSSIIKQFLEEHPLEVLVPYSTRPRRETERDGVDYRFISHEAFQAMLSSTPFLEHIEGFGHHYGIPAPEVLDKLNRGQSLIADFTPEALAQVRTKLSNVKSIFVCPPAMTNIMMRLTARGDEASEHQKRYEYSMAMLEKASYIGYDYLIINETLKTSAAALAAIVRADETSLLHQQRDNALFFNRLKYFRILNELKSTVWGSLDIDACELKSLSSMTNITFQISHAGESYFLRILRQSNSKYRIHSPQEVRNLEKAAELNLYPRVRYYNPETGTYLVPFLSDYTLVKPELLANPALLRSVVHAIKTLHQASPFDNDHSPVEDLEKIIFELKEKGEPLPEDIDRLTVVFHRIHDLLEKTCVQKLPCNNDLSPYNMLYRVCDLAVVISDWENAGNHDPMFDLSKLSVEACFNTKQDKYLLECYFQQSISEPIEARFYLYKFVVEFHLAFWAKWQIMIGNDAATMAQFATMFRVRLDNCRRYLSASRFEKQVNIVRTSFRRDDFSFSTSRFRLLRPEEQAGIEVLPFFKPPAVKKMISAIDEVQQGFVILKPDVALRGNIGAVITQFEHHGFSLKAIKIKTLSLTEVKTLYPALEKQSFRCEVLDLMSSGPVILIVLEGLQIIDQLLRLKGATNPREAKAGTIRQLFGVDSKWNTIHCSDNSTEAQREIALFFSPEELCDESKCCLEKSRGTS